MNKPLTLLCLLVFCFSAGLAQADTHGPLIFEKEFIYESGNWTVLKDDPAHNSFSVKMKTVYQIAEQKAFDSFGAIEYRFTTDKEIVGWTMGIDVTGDKVLDTLSLASSGNSFVGGFEYVFTFDRQNNAAMLDSLWNKTSNFYAQFFAQNGQAEGFEVMNMKLSFRGPAATPIPGAIWLLGGGLAGLAGLRSRMRFSA